MNAFGPIHGWLSKLWSLLGTLNGRCRIMVRIPKGTLISTTTHILVRTSAVCGLPESHSQGPRMISSCVPEWGRHKQDPGCGFGILHHASCPQWYFVGIESRSKTEEALTKCCPPCTARPKRYTTRNPRPPQRKQRGPGSQYWTIDTEKVLREKTSYQMPLVMLPGCSVKASEICALGVRG